MQNTLSKLSIFAWSVMVLLLIPLTINAADEDDVSATVTVQNISISVSDAAIAYGTLAVNSSANTNTLADTQTVTNDGNVTIDMNIKGANTASWTLAGDPGANAYVHQFCTATCGTFPTNYTDLTTSYATLASGKAASATQSLDLGITTPTSSVSFTQQTANVTVQAVLP